MGPVIVGIDYARWPGHRTTAFAFFRGPGRPFTDDERDAAVLLQPHISRALRRQARLRATRLLTKRQVGILKLVAAGHDTTTITRRPARAPRSETARASS